MGASLKNYSEVLMASRVDGAALVAAAAATMLPANLGAKLTFDPGHFGVLGKAIRIEASGRISCAVTTPGTARYDVRFTSPVPTTVIVFDSLAMNLNIVAKNNVHWWLDLILICGVIGSAAQLFPASCRWGSEAVVGSPVPTAGGSGVLNLPYNTPPVLGTAFDGSVAQSMDMFFTQNVATGSMTLHNLLVTALN